MKEVGTLKELDVKPGDVVECVNGKGYATTGYEYTVSAGYKVNGYKIESINSSLFRIISRANTPKLWRDMTDAEKGALLLAFHEGKVIEYWRRGSGGWGSCSSAGIYDNGAYRVRPEPKVATHTHVVFAHGESRGTKYNTIDGKVDWSSFEVMDK